MKNKGQALTEFIILLPLLMLLVTGMVDFGNVIYQKYKLENDLDAVVSFYEEDSGRMSDYVNREKIKATIEEDDVTVTIRISKSVPIYTPGLNRILKSPYPIETQRVIYHES